jgi:putative PIG3 family NAD(P)H quinone oxidoreductase
MKAVLIREPGDESVLALGEAPAPRPGPGEITISVHASALNRADLMQRQGLYPPPPGASEILGLECAGVVDEIGTGAVGWSPGDRVMALLGGGGYAETAVVDAGSVMPIPEALSFDEAAAIPEVFLTAYLNLFELGGLREAATALVHGGGSGVGTAAIQLARASGARILVTAGSAEKCARCTELGADLAINYREESFREVVAKQTEGRGVDVVLDSIGGPYLEDNLASLGRGGRLVLIGLMGGATAELPLGLVLRSHLQVIGSTLRSRPASEKAEIVRNFRTRFGAHLESGKLRPIVDQILSLEQAAEGHRRMKASDHFGKIILRVRSS